MSQAGISLPDACILSKKLTYFYSSLDDNDDYDDNRQDTITWMLEGM